MLALRLLSGLLDLCAPRRCAACDAPLVPDEEGFCCACNILLEPTQDEGRAQAAYLHQGPLADAVRRFKYGPRPALAHPLGQLLAERSLAFAGEVDQVVPVPLHPRRLAERGFNQAALLARPVARALAVPFAPTLLRRTRATPPQAALARRARARNVRAAFGARRAAAARVLLVDDVRTTGATLAACAEALRAAGTLELHTLVLARVE